MKEAVQQPPASSGIGMANWYWKVVRRFASERLGIELSRSSCPSCSRILRSANPTT